MSEKQMPLERLLPFDEALAALLGRVAWTLKPEPVRVAEARAPGGRIVIQDFVLDSTRTKPRAGAVFAVNMLVGTKGGNAYSADEYYVWVKEAGFQNPELIPMAGPSAMVVARRK